MSLKPSVLDKVLKRFRAKKIMTLDLLAAALQRSLRTAQRRLVEWQAINSYNKNGAYYTLPQVPTFDVNGLWHYRDVFFSKYPSRSPCRMQALHNVPSPPPNTGSPHFGHPEIITSDSGIREDRCFWNFSSECRRPGVPSSATISRSLYCPLLAVSE